MGSSKYGKKARYAGVIRALKYPAIYFYRRRAQNGTTLDAMGTRDPELIRFYQL
jgi:hypothetical protein